MLEEEWDEVSQGDFEKLKSINALWEDLFK